MPLQGLNLNTTARSGILRILAVVAVWVGLAVVPHAAQAFSGVDIMVVFDESQSTEDGDFDWLRDTVAQLDTELNGTGVTDNRYGLMSFGMFSVLYGDGMDATVDHELYLPLSSIDAYVSEFATHPIPTPGIGGGDSNLRGTQEDGYSALYDAAMLFDRGDDIARVIIFLTDDDRDDRGYLETVPRDAEDSDFDVVANKLLEQNVILNAVVAVDLLLPNGEQLNDKNALSLGPDMIAYFRDELPTEGAAFGTEPGDNVVSDYVELAFLTGGSVFDIRVLRSENGDAIAALTDRFLATKLAEISIPTPSSVTTAAILLGFVAWRTRRRE